MSDKVAGENPGAPTKKPSDSAVGTQETRGFQLESEAAVLRLFGLNSLAEATRENWPWWGIPRGPFATIEEWAHQPPLVPVVPDFASDHSAAHYLVTRVAESIRQYGDSVEVAIHWQDGPWFSVGWRTLEAPKGTQWGDICGRTLGAALLAALKATS